MSEYTEVEQPFLQQLEDLGWTVIDQGAGVPQDAAPSLRGKLLDDDDQALAQMAIKRHNQSQLRSQLWKPFMPM